jgi:hypothetical protein
MTALLVPLVLVAGLGFESYLSLGADYTTQNYKTGGYDTTNYEWREEDTLDRETEGRGALMLGLELDRGGTTFDVTNTAFFSTRSVRDLVGMELGQEVFSWLAFGLDGDMEFRKYHSVFPQLADTGFSEDYLSGTGRGKVTLRPFGGTELELADRVEVQRYAAPDSYSYDYFLNRASAGLDQELGPLAAFDATYSWSRRWVGQVPDRNYAGHELDAGLSSYLESGWQFALRNTASRRAYPGREHSYWEERLGTSVSRDFTGFGLDVSDDAGWTWYDSVTTVSTNLFQNSLRLEFDIQPFADFTIRAGPRLDFGRNPAGPSDDDYGELSLGAGIDYFRLDKAWLSVEDRVGRRAYPNADSAFQTSYTFNEFSLLGNWTVLSWSAGELRLEGSASVTPEWHADSFDDFMMKSYSLELKYYLK